MMKIVRVEAEVHVFEGASDLTNPIAIGIAFSDGSMARIRCSGDGESVTVDNEALQGPANWGEFGGAELCSLADHVAPGIFGAEIVAVFDIVDGHGVDGHGVDGRGHFIGVALHNESDVMFCVWNYGDELHYGEAAKLLAQDWEALPGFQPRAGDGRRQN
ncbi:hypothetical protein ACHMW7_08910 [Aminobacter sp. UC22_36]|uniref:hypothetical protein n=1 Tax=Aminobacter sp. UC22_36 TaxID=3374549 RepID=UPI003756458C